MGISGVIEIRFHGRGGQGAVTAARLLAMAAYKAGFKGVQAYPFFGAERRGAPVVAYFRMSKELVKLHSMIKNPDAIVVLDDSLLDVVDVTSGLKEGGKVIINTSSSDKVKEKIDTNKFKLYCVDCTSIALDLGLVIAGIPVVNTAILGAVSKVIGIPVENVVDAVKESWRGSVAERNAKAVLRAYDSVKEVS